MKNNTYVKELKKIFSIAAAIIVCPCMIALATVSDSGMAKEKNTQMAKLQSQVATPSDLESESVMNDDVVSAEVDVRKVAMRKARIRQLKNGQQNEDKDGKVYKKIAFVYTEEMYKQLSGEDTVPEDWLSRMDDLMRQVAIEESEFIETEQTDNGQEEQSWEPLNAIDASLYSTAINSTEPLPAALHAVRFSETKIGYPYSQPRRDTGAAYDCSSLVYWAYKDAGINIDPVEYHTAASIAKHLDETGRNIGSGDLKPGDLIFYSYKENGRYKNISHVAMVIEGGMQIQASSTHKRVMTSGIDLRKAVAIGRPVMEATAGELTTDAEDELELINDIDPNVSLSDEYEASESSMPDVVEYESNESNLENYGPGFVPVKESEPETEAFGPGFLQFE